MTDPQARLMDDDDFYCDSPAFRRFVETLKSTVAATESIYRRIAELKGPFAELLRDPTWLLDAYSRPVEKGGMGSGAASYLLYQARDGTLTVSSLVLAAGATTPVHDHLAWGLVGLYRGEQDEEVFRRLDDGNGDGVARLELVERRHLLPGDSYNLVPPDGDIHRVACRLESPSISIHVLGNDVGCVHRHVFEPDRSLVQPFRSGYVNVPCSSESGN